MAVKPIPVTSQLPTDIPGNNNAGYSLNADGYTEYHGISQVLRLMIGGGQPDNPQLITVQKMNQVSQFFAFWIHFWIHRMRDVPPFLENTAF